MNATPFSLPSAHTASGPPARSLLHAAALCTGLAAAISAFAQPPQNALPLSSISRLPVREVTAFKNGYAFVLHEGPMPVDPRGTVVMDRLPAPVIGTFWAYSAAEGVKLVSVLASQRRVEVERTALTLRELLEANQGAEAFVTETNGVRYPATILGFPERTSRELTETGLPDAGERLPQKGQVVMLQVVEGVKALPFAQIQDVTFKHPPKPKVAEEEFRNFLTLQLDYGGRAPGQMAEVGLVYLQQGIRWIPSYKVELDGQGQARIELQATVLNELHDLEKTTLNLVIGVPTFYFKDTIDPIALQETAARLSSYFQTDSGRSSRQSALGLNFSNAMMTQTARMGESRGRAGGEGGGAGADFPESAKNEDLFVFTLKEITLKKGERMVLPLVEYRVPYQDVFALTLAFAPPPEMQRNMNTQQQAELQRLFSAPKVMHKIRLDNNSAYPFTTAPALLLKEGRVISQGMMTYAAPGSSTDLDLTTAVDIQVKKTDNELKRTPDAFRVNNDSYMRVDLQGEIQLTNHRGGPVSLEITRHVLGVVDEAGQDGTITMNNVFESGDYLPAGDYQGTPYWWNWFNWPWWWHHVNGVGRIDWKLTLQAGKQATLTYKWHYHWR